MQKEKITLSNCEYIIPAFDVCKKLDNIKLIIFDWDGVFHSGQKNAQGESSFSEIDSMGINLLRFGLWNRKQKMPFTIIVTGEENPTAQTFALREHFNAVYFKAKNKSMLLPIIEKQFDVSKEQILFFFDDILDIGLAQKVGLRFFVKKESTCILYNEVKKNKWCDIASSCSGADHAIRQLCEEALYILGDFSKILKHRIEFSEKYNTYWKQRNKIQCQLSNFS